MLRSTTQICHKTDGDHLSALPFLASGVVAARLLQLAGSPEQQAAWLPRIARGEAIATLALDEGPKHRPDDIALRAQAHAGGWRLAGTKAFYRAHHRKDIQARLRVTEADASIARAYALAARRAQAMCLAGAQRGPCPSI